MANISLKNKLMCAASHLMSNEEVAQLERMLEKRSVKTFVDELRVHEEDSNWCNAHEEWASKIESAIWQTFKGLPTGKPKKIKVYNPISDEMSEIYAPTALSMADAPEGLTKIVTDISDDARDAGTREINRATYFSWVDKARKEGSIVYAATSSGNAAGTYYIASKDAFFAHMRKQLAGLSLKGQPDSAKKLLVRTSRTFGYSREAEVALPDGEVPNWENSAIINDELEDVVVKASWRDAEGKLHIDEETKVSVIINDGAAYAKTKTAFAAMLLSFVKGIIVYCPEMFADREGELDAYGDQLRRSEKDVLFTKSAWKLGLPKAGIPEDAYFKHHSKAIAAIKAYGGILGAGAVFDKPAAKRTLSYQVVEYLKPECAHVIARHNTRKAKELMSEEGALKLFAPAMRNIFAHNPQLMGIPAFRESAENAYHKYIEPLLCGGIAGAAENPLFFVDPTGYIPKGYAMYSDAPKNAQRAAACSYPCSYKGCLGIFNLMPFDGNKFSEHVFVISRYDAEWLVSSNRDVDGDRVGVVLDERWVALINEALHAGPVENTILLDESAKAAKGGTLHLSDFYDFMLDAFEHENTVSVYARDNDRMRANGTYNVERSINAVNGMNGAIDAHKNDNADKKVGVAKTNEKCPMALTHCRKPVPAYQCGWTNGILDKIYAIEQETIPTEWTPAWLNEFEPKANKYLLGDIRGLDSGMYKGIIGRGTAKNGYADRGWFSALCSNICKREAEASLKELADVRELNDMLVEDEIRVWLNKTGANLNDAAKVIWANLCNMDQNDPYTKWSWNQFFRHFSDAICECLEDRGMEAVADIPDIDVVDDYDDEIPW